MKSPTTLFLNKEVIQPVTHGGQESLLIPFILWGWGASIPCSFTHSLPGGLPMSQAQFRAEPDVDDCYFCLSPPLSGRRTGPYLPTTVFSASGTEEMPNKHLPSVHNLRDTPT